MINIFMSPHLRGGGHSVFKAEPIDVGLGVGIGVGMTLSCLHNILFTSGWILTKFSLIYNCDITKS